MSDTIKSGKHHRKRIPSAGNAALQGTVVKRHIFGSTEKILRRNRKIWTRLTAKIRRRLDEKAIQESTL